MADVNSNLKNWSTTESNNSPSGATVVGTGLDDNLRMLQTVVRQDLANKGADIASATTTDLGAIAGSSHDITGTTTITSFGTVSAGIWKWLRFTGALTLTHNATSLILPGAANITTVNGDTAFAESLGSGNWIVRDYVPTIAPASKGTTATTFTFDGSGGTSASVTLTWQKIGQWVTLNIPAVSATTGTNSQLLTSNTAIAAAARPATQQFSRSNGVIVNNGSNLGPSGVIVINTNGTFSVERDGVGTLFTNSASGGTANAASVTYFVG